MSGPKMSEVFMNIYHNVAYLDGLMVGAGATKSVITQYLDKPLYEFLEVLAMNKVELDRQEVNAVNPSASKIPLSAMEAIALIEIANGAKLSIDLLEYVPQLISKQLVVDEGGKLSCTQKGKNRWHSMTASTQMFGGSLSSRMVKFLLCTFLNLPNIDPNSDEASNLQSVGMIDIRGSSVSLTRSGHDRVHWMLKTI